MERRILSIDGGGIKGVYPLAVLATLERLSGQRMGRCFDLIAGTSTGGVIAMALALGFSARQMLHFYLRMGPRVFQGHPGLRFIRQLGISKYSSVPLYQTLQTVYGDFCMENLKTRVVVPSLNLETGSMHLFTTPHHPSRERDRKVTLLSASMAAVASPSYFPTHRNAAGIPMIDGGVWANNPIVLAIHEALGVLEWPRSEMRVLSIGTTVDRRLNAGLGGRFSLGFGYWGWRLTRLQIRAQSSAAMTSARLLLGENKVHRIDREVDPGRYTLDDWRKMPDLRRMGAEDGRQAYEGLERSFFSEPVEESPKSR